MKRDETVIYGTTPAANSTVSFVQTAFRNHAPTTILRSTSQPCVPSMLVDPGEVVATGFVIVFPRPSHRPITRRCLQGSADRPMVAWCSCLSSPKSQSSFSDRAETCVGRMLHSD